MKPTTKDQITPGYWYVKCDVSPGYFIVLVGVDELKAQCQEIENESKGITTPVIREKLVWAMDEERAFQIEDIGAENFIKPVPSVGVV